MSRYPMYGMHEDPVWSRGGSVVMDPPPRGTSHAPTHYASNSHTLNTLPYPTYPQAHTTVVHSSVKPAPDADIYRVGIYGWRKRCLYIFILILTIVIVLNMALTAWIMSVLDFSTDGMGALKIIEDGIHVKGRAQFDKPVHFSHLTTTRGEAMTIQSFRGVHMQARNASGQPSSSFTLASEGKAQVVCDRFEITDKENKLLFFADSEEIGVKLPNLRILDDGGSVFEGAIQTAYVRPEPDTPLRLESPTRSISVDASQDIELLTAAGEIKLNSLLDITMTSKKGEIRLESQSIYVEGLPRSVGRGAPQLQLCVCHNGRLFLSVQGADCRADRNICE
ncbi:unnamed protein product [Auanema sp. JU1783]|nr:unnamed protein product [Auanema sp. JU1783]